MYSAVTNTLNDRKSALDVLKYSVYFFPRKNKKTYKKKKKKSELDFSNIGDNKRRSLQLFIF